MFWQNFEQLCRERGVSPTAVIQELKMSTGTVTNWRNGAKPTNKGLKKVADYFGVTTEELLNGVKEKTATSSGDGLSEKDELKRLLDRLTDEEVHDLLVLVKQIILGL